MCTVRRQRLAGIAVVAALVAACGDSAPTAPVRSATATGTPDERAAPSLPSDEQQLTALLAARANALVTHDAAALAGTATGSQRAKDRRALRAARPLPLASVRLHAGKISVRGDRARIRAELSYRFAGIDTHYVKPSQLLATRTHAGWRIAEDRPTGGVRAPWEYRAYRATTSRHFLALTPKALETPGLMDDLEAGYARMRDGLPGVRKPRRVLVIVAETGADTRALTKDIAAVQALTAISETQYSVQGPAKRVAEVWGQRVFVLWPQYSGRTPEQRRTVIAHELVHTALATRTSGRTPPWLYEGIALYVSGDDRTSEAREAGHVMSLARLSPTDSFARLPPAQLRLAYAYASAAAFAIADRWGPDALLRLLSAFNSEKVRGTPGRRLTDRAVRRALKVSLAQLEAVVI